MAGSGGTSRGGEECGSTCGCQRLLGSLVTHRHQPAVEDSTPELPACLPLCEAQGLWNCASKGQTHGQHCHQTQQHQPAGSVSGHGCHVCRPHTKLHSPQWCAQNGFVQGLHSPKQERRCMSSAKPFPKKNHTQPSRQPTCNITTGRLSPFNSPQSPQLFPFNSSQSPKPAAPYPASCSSRLSAMPLQQDFSGTQSRTSPPPFHPPVSHRHSPLPRRYNRTSVVRSLALLPPPLNPLLSPTFILTLTLASRPPSTLTALNPALRHTNCL